MTSNGIEPMLIERLVLYRFEKWVHLKIQRRENGNNVSIHFPSITHIYSIFSMVDHILI